MIEELLGAEEGGTFLQDHPKAQLGQGIDRLHDTETLGMDTKSQNFNLGPNQHNQQEQTDDLSSPDFISQGYNQAPSVSRMIKEIQNK